MLEIDFLLFCQSLELFCALQVGFVKGKLHFVNELLKVLFDFIICFQIDSVNVNLIKIRQVLLTQFNAPPHAIRRGNHDISIFKIISNSILDIFLGCHHPPVDLGFHDLADTSTLSFLRFIRHHILILLGKI